MNMSSLVTRVFGVVDRTLRREFPTDYDRRCMYAAFGIFELLKDAGVESRIIGGDFLAFVVAASGARAGLQGFGNPNEPNSHFWVELPYALLDLGPHYLPKGSRFSAASIPIVAWVQPSSLPKFLRYRANMKYDPRVQLASTPEIMERMIRFISECRQRYKAQQGQPKLPSWILSNEDSLHAAAKAGDFWARNAIRFSAITPEEQLPF